MKVIMHANALQHGLCRVGIRRRTLLKVKRSFEMKVTPVSPHHHQYKYILCSYIIFILFDSINPNPNPIYTSKISKRYFLSEIYYL